jgi:hypothetical protein
LSPKGEFWNRLERALDLSKNVSEPAKNDFRLGNIPSNFVLLEQVQSISVYALSSHGSNVFEPDGVIFFRAFFKLTGFDGFDIKTPSFVGM